jgi:hypothetical protein
MNARPTTLKRTGDTIMNARLTLFALILLTTPGLALAARDACTMDKVAGTYGFSASGTILSPNAMGLPAGPVAATGVMTLDKHGSFHGKETMSFNGSIVSGVTFDGTYVLNPDCTLTLEVPGFFHNFGVIVAGGNEMFLMLTDNGVVATITVKRIDSH